MKKMLITILLIFAMALPLQAIAGVVVGTVQGFTCVTTGKICPVDKEDPLVAATRVFVVKTEGTNYYFVPNLDRALLARYLNKKVRVVGHINPKYRAITVDEFQVWKDGKWKTVWNKELEDEIRKEFEVGN